MKGLCNLQQITIPAGMCWSDVRTFDQQTRTLHVVLYDNTLNAYIAQYNIDTWKMSSAVMPMPTNWPVAIAVAHELN